MAELYAFTMEKKKTPLKVKVRWLFPPSWQEKVIVAYGFKINPEEASEVFKNKAVVKLRKAREKILSSEA